MINDGKNYELFVASLHQALLNADEFVPNQKNILVEINKKIIDRCGIERQFDIYWEYELAGLLYKTVIECKDYNSKVSVEKIDALIGKVRDIPDLKAVFATKLGYQSGAKVKAEQNKIDLLVVRAQNETDWIDVDGTPLIRTICVKTHILVPAQILEFLPFLDKNWIEKNTDLDTSQPMSFSGLGNEIFIENVDEEIRYSLHELSSMLAPIGSESFGVFDKEEAFENAFICYNGTKLKLLSYKVKYCLSPPVENSFEIDFSKELVGVIEYLQKGTKRTFYKNGMIK